MKTATAERTKEKPPPEQQAHHQKNEKTNSEEKTSKWNLATLAKGEQKI